MNSPKYSTLVANNLKEALLPDVDPYNIIKEYAKIDHYTTLTYVYWNTCISVMSLLDTLGYDTKDSGYLRKNNLINDQYMNVQCSICKKTKEVAIESRSALRRLEDTTNTYACTECTPELPKPPKVIPKTIALPPTMTHEIYQEYLKSDHWYVKRTRSFAIAGYKCQVCSSKVGINVHHNNYNNLNHETVKDLVVLCGKCHELFHEKSSICC